MKNIKIFFLVCITAVYLQANDLIKIGTSANYPPFEYIDDQNKIVGFDIDLIDNLSKKLGFEYKIINMGFDGLIPALKSTKIDAIASAMSATPARIKAVDFTKPYFHTENLYIKSKDDNSISKIEDLKGKKLCAQLGTVQEMAARELAGVKVVAMEDVGACVLALKAGKIEAIITDSSIGYGYIKKNPSIVNFAIVPDGSEGFSMAFDKNKHTELISKIDNAIEEFKKDGTYDELLKKYDLK